MWRKLPEDDLVATLSRAEVDAFKNDFEIEAVEKLLIDVTAEVSIADGYDFAEVCEKIERALGAYFTGERLGESVPSAAVGALIYGVEGVTNCHLLAPTTDTAANLTRLPVLGTVVLSEIGADNE